MIDPIPDDCLPPRRVIDALLRGPDIDDEDRIVGGLWHGMTPAQVLAQRDRYERAGSESLMRRLRENLKS